MTSWWHHHPSSPGPSFFCMGWICVKGRVQMTGRKSNKVPGNRKILQSVSRTGVLLVSRECVLRSHFPQEASSTCSSALDCWLRLLLVLDLHVRSLLPCHWTIGRAFAFTPYSLHILLCTGLLLLLLPLFITACLQFVHFLWKQTFHQLQPHSSVWSSGERVTWIWVLLCQVHGSAEVWMIWVVIIKKVKVQVLMANAEKLILAFLMNS